MTDEATLARWIADASANLVLRPQTKVHIAEIKTEHWVPRPATLGQLQQQIAELRALLQDVLNALPKPTAEEGTAKADALKLRLMQEIKAGLEEPGGLESGPAIQNPEAVEDALEGIAGLPHGTKQVLQEEGRRVTPEEAREFMERIARLPHRRKP